MNRLFSGGRSQVLPPHHVHVVRVEGAPAATFRLAMVSDANSIEDRNPLSLPGNYVTVTFVVVSPSPLTLSLSMFHYRYHIHSNTTFPLLNSLTILS